MEKKLVEYIVKSLVDRPDEIKVDVIEDDRAVTLELRAAESDLGKVIGKQGRIAKAISTVLSATATEHGKRINLEIID